MDFMKYIFLFHLIMLSSFQLAMAQENIAIQDVYASDVIQEFYSVLQEEIKAAELYVIILFEEYSERNQIPSAQQKLELDTYITMLDVKKILYGQFVDSPFILVKEIQDKLLDIFQKPIIDEIDLIELESLLSKADSMDYNEVDCRPLRPIVHIVISEYPLVQG
jgi:hypothetical protein